jgi:hypothetical protein
MNGTLIDYVCDVFVSYRRQKPVQIWVASYFIELFENWLEQELGRAPVVFWDEDGLDNGDLWKPKIMHKLAGSRCIVTIWSKGYFLSPWCVAEWETFRRRGTMAKLQTTGLVVPIQWQDGDSYPDEAKAFKPADFRKYALTAAAFPGTTLFLEYEQDVQRLAISVAKKIEQSPNFDLSWNVVDPDTIHIDAAARNGWAHTLRAVGPN